MVRFSDFARVIRSFKSNFWTNLINISVFSIATVCLLFVGEYIVFETSYDEFLPNNGEIYRVTLLQKEGEAVTDHTAMTYTNTGPFLKESFDEVIASTTVYNIGVAENLVLSKNENDLLVKEIIQGDSTFFKVFQHEFVQGSPETSLSTPRSLVLTESMAEKLFGNTNAVGEQVTLKSRTFQAPYQVTGVIKDLPKSTHLPFQVVLSANFNRNWNYFDYYTYIQLSSESNALSKLDREIPEFIETHVGDPERMDFVFQPITDIHLYSKIRNEFTGNGSYQLIVMIGIIGGLTFLMGLINFVSLSLSIFSSRHKEFQVRRTIGGNFGSFASQLFVESFFQSVLILLTIGIMARSFLVAKSLAFSSMAFLDDYTINRVVLLSVAILFITLFLIWLIYLIACKQMFLKSSISSTNKLKHASGEGFKRGLTAVQFFIALTLLTSALLVRNQINHLQNVDLGFDSQGIITFKGPSYYRNDSTLTRQLSAFQNRLLQNSHVLNLSFSSDIPGKEIWSNNNVSRINRTQRLNVSTASITCDTEYMYLYVMPIVTGRYFELYDNGDKNIIINENLREKLEFASNEAALDQKVDFQGEQYQIVGVIQDYYQESPKSGVKPLLFRHQERNKNFISVAFNQTAGGESFDEIIASWDEVFPNVPSEYQYVEDYYSRQLQDITDFRNLVFYLSLISTLIGFLGLSIFIGSTLMSRDKELAIRLVHGASFKDLFALVSKPFLLLFGLCAVSSVVLVYLVFNDWLENFNNRIDLNSILNLLPLLGLFVVIVSIITFQLRNHYRKDPIQSLRLE